MQDKFLIVYDDGVACVIAALEADNDIGLSGKYIYYLSLPFVPPLCAY
jgi:hypothetical protein